MKKIILLIIISMLLSCSDDPKTTQKPNPINLDGDEIGYYMQMTLVDHAGPKAQLWLSDKRKPLWFVDVRDAILFKRTPEEADNIAAIYAHDMAKNSDYNNVKDIWIDLEQAVFVVDSQQKGGMGMPETIPFSDKQSAQDFIARHGGKMVNSLSELKTEYLTSISASDCAVVK